MTTIIALLSIIALISATRLYVFSKFVKEATKRAEQRKRNPNALLSAEISLFNDLIKLNMKETTDKSIVSSISVDDDINDKESL